MHALSKPEAIVALILFVGFIASGVRWAVARRIEAGDYGPDELPHGDVIHVPVGATPPKLINHEGE